MNYLHDQCKQHDCFLHRHHPLPYHNQVGKEGRRPRLRPFLNDSHPLNTYHIGKPESCFDRLRRALSGYGVSSPNDDQRAPPLWNPAPLAGGRQAPQQERHLLRGKPLSVWAGMTVSTPYPPSGKAPSVRYRGHRRKWPTTSPGEEGKPK